MSISNHLLAAGAALHIEAVHGEPVRILGGTDAGQTFTAVIEIQTDAILTGDLGEDPRGKTMIHFIGNPVIGSQTVVQRADGTKWKAVREPQGNYLTNDYELIQVVPGKDS